MLVFAAPGLVAMYDHVKKSGPQQLIRFAPALIGLLIICNLPLVDTKLARSITYSNFGVEALIRDDVALAEKFLGQALELKSDNAVAHSNLAVLYWRKHGRHDKAEEHFLKALELSPEFESARQRLEKMKRELAGIERNEAPLRQNSAPVQLPNR